MIKIIRNKDIRYICAIFSLYAFQRQDQNTLYYFLVVYTIQQQAASFSI